MQNVSNVTCQFIQNLWLIWAQQYLTVRCIPEVEWQTNSHESLYGEEDDKPDSYVHADVHWHFYHFTTDGV